MSVDSTREQIRATKEAILKPFKEIVANRKSAKEKHDRDDDKTRMIAIGMRLHLDHVDDYMKQLDEEYEIENRTSKAYEIRRKLESEFAVVVAAPERISETNGVGEI